MSTALLNFIVASISAWPVLVQAQVMAPHDPSFGNGVNTYAWASRPSAHYGVIRLPNGDFKGLGKSDRYYSYLADPDGLSRPDYGEFGIAREYDDVGFPIQNGLFFEDGSIVIRNSHASIVSLIRLMPDGSRDMSYGENGIASLPVMTINGYSALQPSRVLFSGHVDGQFHILAYDSAGNIDPSFGNNGVISLPDWLACTYIVTLDDGRFICRTSSNGTTALLMFDANGIVDLTFADNGVLLFTQSPFQNINQFSLQIDGKILYTNGTSIRRINQDGTMDTSLPGPEMLSVAQLMSHPNGKYTYFMGSQLHCREMNGAPGFGDGNAISLSHIEGRRVFGMDDQERLLISGSESPVPGWAQPVLTRILPDGSTDLTLWHCGYCAVQWYRYEYHTVTGLY